MKPHVVLLLICALDVHARTALTVLVAVAVFLIALGRGEVWASGCATFVGNPKGYPSTRPRICPHGAACGGIVPLRLSRQHGAYESLPICMTSDPDDAGQVSVRATDECSNRPPIFGEH